MGLMSERARLAHLDYVRLAATEGCSLYFDELLKRGFQAWPIPLRQRYPALADWGGTTELNSSLRRIIGVPEDCPVMLASRTAQLMKLAARRLCENSTRILVTDLTWPSYRRILEFERRAHRVGISTVSIRQEVHDGTLAPPELVDAVADQYVCMGCDGLFVPVVSHDGIRLPVDAICRRLSEIGAPRFVVVDGAQAFCHVPDELGLTHCDFFLTGCHKWLQGHVPMGIAFLSNQQSARATLSAAERMFRHTELDDPLLAFTNQLQSGSIPLYSETVNLASLFSCQAAIAERGGLASRIDQQFAERLQNAARVAGMARKAGWTPLPAALPNGIVMLRANCPTVRYASPDFVRQFFVRHAVSLSSYEGGIVRMAMPDRPLRTGELDLLNWILRQCVGLPIDVFREPTAEVRADVAMTVPT
jgi:aspartate aminotransferase-like enzyme